VVWEKTEKQYQTELPRKPIHRQFNVAVGRCKKCGKRVQGRHPLQTSNALGAAASQVGPDAQALTTLLNKELGLSHGKVTRVLEVLGLPLSRGGSVQVMLRAARVCRNAYQEIQLVVRRSAWVTADETGWRVLGCLQWLHVFVTELATLYLIRPSRGYDVPLEALGAEYEGELIHDGWMPYDRFVDNDHQQCNAHLLRRCHELEETARGAAVIFPRRVQALLQEGLAVRDQRDAGQITLAQAEVCAAELEERLEALCTPKTHDGNRKFAAFLERHWMEVFHYLRRPGLDATNWRAEQAIRPAVVNRKVWGGNRTEHGARAQEILTSVLRTTSQQAKDCITFLAASLRAPPTRRPRLLPAS
jgi:transposase